MNNVWKKVLPILLMVWPYVFLALFCVGGANPSWVELVLQVDLFGTGAIVIFNIINAFTYTGEHREFDVARWGMWIKLGHIPFYLFVFVMIMLLVVSAVVPAMIFMTPFFIVCLVVGSYCLLIITSMYGISALVQSAKQKKVSTSYAVVQIILHCIFVTDVISAIIIFFKLRKQKKAVAIY